MVFECMETVDTFWSCLTPSCGYRTIQQSILSGQAASCSGKAAEVVHGPTIMLDVPPRKSSEMQGHTPVAYGKMYCLRVQK